MSAMHEIASYKYCPQCGAPLTKRLLKPLEPPRLVCAGCGFIFYLDPKLSVIAVIPLDEGVVMVRRAIEPGYGLWVVPGGFVDLGEVVEDALVRETQEETCLTVRPIRLLNIYSYRDHRTVIAAYETEYVSGELAAGDETLEARVFGLKEIPWSQIAFSSTKEALREYLSRFKK
jgi:ADP-ribose pyrophosphatase YjhB (NUDIX family)